MNRQTPFISTSATSTAGTTPVALSFTGGRSVPVVGKLLRLGVVMASGQTTTATIELINSSGPIVIAKWAGVTLTTTVPFDVMPIPIVWDVPTGPNLQVRITTNDGANGTTLAVTMTAEVT